MAHISVHMQLTKFSIQHENESSLDEPYIWPIFILLDGRVLNEPQDSPTLPMFAPSTGHGNIHHVNDRVSDNISFTWESDIDPGGMAISPQIWKAGCFVIAAVAFMEQDGWTDSDALAAHDAAIKELQKQGNSALLVALQELNFPSNLTIDENALKLAIMLRLMPKKLGDVLIQGFIPFADIVYNVINIASLADPDDYVGDGYTRGFNVGELIGNNPRGFEFSISSGDQGEGVYSVDGAARRSDTDEVPIVGITRISNNVHLYGRNIEDGLELFTSADAGATFTNNGRFSSGLFLAGPAACSSINGLVQYVAGRGLDSRFYLASKLPSTDFSEFRQLVDGTFKSAPAICCNADGQWLHIVGRGTDDRYWHGVSHDFGVTVQGWWPIGDGSFRSAPAVVLTPDGSRLMVFGLGTDNNLWWAFSHDHGSTWDMAWDLLPVGKGNTPFPYDAFTSAPAAAVSGDGKTVQVVCRGSNRTFWTTSSGDGGQQFFGYWFPVGGGTFYSAPAVVSDATGKNLCVVGLGEDLYPWRCLYGGVAAANHWGRIQPDGGFGMMYY
jgi:hypothetical protein